MFKKIISRITIFSLAVGIAISIAQPASAGVQGQQCKPDRYCSGSGCAYNQEAGAYYSETPIPGAVISDCGNTVNNTKCCYRILICKKGNWASSAWNCANGVYTHTFNAETPSCKATVVPNHVCNIPSID